MKIIYLDQHQVETAYRIATTTGRKKTRQRNYVMLKVLVETGVRVSELINIRPKSFDLVNNHLNVVGKGNKLRKIDYTPHLTPILMMFIDSNNIKSNMRIFPLTRNAIYKITKRIIGYKPHAFRHTYAINLLKKTKNIRYVQRQLGHSRMDTTEVYLDYVDFETEKKLLSNGVMA